MYGTLSILYGSFISATFSGMITAVLAEETSGETRKSETVALASV
jgi:hypothetical protein